ncbi:MAG: hypothetical protein ABIZ34_08940 [Candidatus Limnocylindrales bacterium]
MYRDYAISRDLFHWESQNATHEDTPTGLRYIDHRAASGEIMLVVCDLEHIGRTAPARRSHASARSTTCAIHRFPI